MAYRLDQPDGTRAHFINKRQAHQAKKANGGKLWVTTATVKIDPAKPWNIVEVVRYGSGNV